MSQTQKSRRDIERAQFATLSQLRDLLHRRLWSLVETEQLEATMLNDTQLQTLGVVRRANLDIDNWHRPDFEPVFFSPYCDENSQLQEVLEYRKQLWCETLDEDKDTNPEWIPNPGWRYPEVRALWFQRTLRRLERYYDEDSDHPINNYTMLQEEEMQFRSPMGAQNRNDHENDTEYHTGNYMYSESRFAQDNSPTIASNRCS
ncbi:hypothetical protein VTH06DRAFT_4641 [Thermothelomyces fergusii]